MGSRMFAKCKGFHVASVPQQCGRLVVIGRWSSGGFLTPGLIRRANCVRHCGLSFSSRPRLSIPKASSTWPCLIFIAFISFIIALISNARSYKWEERQIDAWEERKVAKATVTLSKVESDLEKKREKATERMQYKVAQAHTKATKMKAYAEAKRAERAAKVAMQAQFLRVLDKSPLFCFCGSPLRSLYSKDTSTPTTHNEESESLTPDNNF